MVTLDDLYDADFMKEHVDDIVHIYVPSSGRPFKQTTLYNIPYRWLYRTKVVVYEDEYEAYSRELKLVKNRFWPLDPFDEIKIVVCPVKRGIGRKRQWIMDQHTTGLVCMFDDDLRFFAKRRGTNAIEQSTEEDFDRMMVAMAMFLNSGQTVQVGLGYKSLASFVRTMYKEIGQVYSAYCFNVELFHKTGLRFDRLEVMEDTYITLGLIAKGFKNKILWQWPVEQNKVGATGGCSSYRTYEVQYEAAKEMVRLFPGIVRIFERKTDLAFRKCEIKIAWKKAYTESQKGFKRRQLITI